MTKTILVTGAEGFLGQAAVRFLSRQGMIVAASCRTDSDAAIVRKMVQMQGLKDVSVRTCDLTDEAALGTMVQRFEVDLGPIAGAMNAAGGFRWSHAETLSEADFDFLIGSNLKSAWLLARTLLPRFRAQGYGRLVFVSAKSTQAPSEAGMAIYNASKVGLNALVESLAREVKGTPITVNAVMPSVIDTPANRQAMPDAPWTDWVTTDEIMQAAWIFLGPESSAYNGSLLAVAGRV